MNNRLIKKTRPNVTAKRKGNYLRSRGETRPFARSFYLRSPKTLLVTSRAGDVHRPALKINFYQKVLGNSGNSDRIGCSIPRNNYRVDRKLCNRWVFMFLSSSSFLLRNSFHKERLAGGDSSGYNSIMDEINNAIEL